MKTSIFVPCIQKHTRYIRDVVTAYCRGTVKPDEIIVFISGARSDCVVTRKSHVEINREDPFLAGPARQMAEELCSGDIILYQDADDMPHPQRVEIVKQYFERYDIVHLTHSYAFLGQLPPWADKNIHFTSNTMPRKIDAKDIVFMNGNWMEGEYFPGGELTDCTHSASSWGPTDCIQHAGACCVRREVLNKVKWKKNTDLKLAPINRGKAEDYEFCMECAFEFKKSMMISAVLYQYRV